MAYDIIGGERAVLDPVTRNAQCAMRNTPMPSDRRGSHPLRRGRMLQAAFALCPSPVVRTAWYGQLGTGNG